MDTFHKDLKFKIEGEETDSELDMKGDYRKETLEKFIYRRQFIFGPSGINDIQSSWNILNINKSYFVATHPDLEVHQANILDKSITLLGFILDPYNPNATNSDIIDNLIYKLDNCDDFHKHIFDYGGRWILIVSDGAKIIILNDAAGLRQIYYAQSPPGSIWCASQAGLLAEVLHFGIDKEAFEFMKLREIDANYDDCKVYWWPGNRSLYKEIKILLPNHSLDINTGSQHRYWPSEDLNKISIQEAVNRTSIMLCGLMRSAHNRYKLTLAMTAGWDSRLMLALSKDYVDDLYIFTLNYPGIPLNDKDLLIPEKLLNKLGVKHNIIKFPDHVNDDFKKICKNNSSSANSAFCADVQAMYDYLPENRMCITGDVAEVVKCYYRLPELQGRNISGHDLAGLTNMGMHPYAIKAYDEWLSGVKLYNIDLLDLFSWEQVGGRWQSLNQAEYDIVQESFSPYNCRSLLSTILSIDEKFRRPPVHTFHKKLIGKLWKKVLTEPINPPDSVTMKTVLVDLLIKLHLYQLIPEKSKLSIKRMINKIQKFKGISKCNY